MNTERDAPMDRLIASALAARADTEPGPSCLDAETLAAWADGALDARERASAEAHAADCARCQQLLAAMVRTLPPAAVQRKWRMPTLGWLVPLTAAATALAIWVAVPRPAPVVVSDGGAAAIDQVTSPAPSAAIQERPAENNAAGRAAAAVEPQSPQRAAAEAKVEPEERFAPQPSTPAETESPATLRDRRDSASLQKQASTDAQTMDAQASPESPSVVAPSPAGAPAPLSAPASGQTADANLTLRREAPRAAARASAFAGPPETIVVSTNPATRFRLLRGGGVQRSADAGATWRTETTNATDTLTAGASPSPSVCWLVGPAGTVLLSTDGRTWRRLSFPERADLRAVVATDHENATVSTADGRSFVTADGGQTWSRTPGI